jgi:hypothetical protein
LSAFSATSSSPRTRHRKRSRWPPNGRVDLSAEAIRLGRSLVELMPDEAEARALLELMLLGHARSAAGFLGGEPNKRKPPLSGAFLGGPAWTRTKDRRIMSPLL